MPRDTGLARQLVTTGSAQSVDRYIFACVRHKRARLARTLRQHEQNPFARPARRLDDRAARAARQRRHVQAIQRRPHQQSHASHRRAVPHDGPAIEFNQPHGGMFFWAKLTEGRNANDFAKRAIDKLVAFVPGAPFFARAPDLSTLRLSFATADVAKIEEGIGRLRQAL